MSHNFCLSVNVSVVAVIKEASSLLIVWNFFDPVLRNLFSRLQLISRFWGLLLVFFFMFRIDWSSWDFCLFSLRVWNYPFVELIHKSKWDYIWTKIEISVFPVEFRKTIWCNRFLRSWRMLIQRAYNSKKIRKLFLRSLIN